MTVNSGVSHFFRCGIRVEDAVVFSSGVMVDDGSLVDLAMGCFGDDGADGCAAAGSRAGHNVSSVNTGGV